MLNKFIIFIIIVLIIVVVGLYRSATGRQVDGPVACTADAIECPDGTWVGRTGPNCEFVCPSE